MFTLKLFSTLPGFNLDRDAGDPLTACRQSRKQQANVVGFSRFKRNLSPYFLLFPEN
jgi:hypothetical protein